MSLTVFWFRRDLRLHDNHGLFQALKGQKAPLQPIFIFDKDILGPLENPADFRIPFLHESVLQIKSQLRALDSDLWIFHGRPLEVFKDLFKKQTVDAVYLNHDYEPLAMERDAEIEKLCLAHGIAYRSFKDHVIFEKEEILNQKGFPYTVYTPYKKKWLATLAARDFKSFQIERLPSGLCWSSRSSPVPSLKELGFVKTEARYPKATFSKKLLKDYAGKRDFPAEEGTSHMGLHLRFGTVSIREAVAWGRKWSPSWLSELIWREFFIQILFHFPEVEKKSFRKEYEGIQWRKSRKELELWKEGRTGYPFVDAGMRELRQTGFMHNRARMVTASFLTKHLLMHWSLGESHFGSLLLDYELAVNNGNWQWCAGTGCDAAPFFRIFNPETQAKKFDPQNEYIRRWVPEWGTPKYPKPLIAHPEARERALRAFYFGLKGKKG